jgi:dTDP-glucose 4,6-dehydratase
MLNVSKHPLASDLDNILEHTADIWKELQGANIFITGGTGFIGTWLVDSLVWGRRRYGIDFGMTILTRNRLAFEAKVPYLSDESRLDYVLGDVRTFRFPKQSFTHVIHAATAASAKLNLEEPYEMVDTIVSGGKRVFEFAGQCGSKCVLHTSSGGIYGKQPSELLKVSEEYYGAPDPMDPFAAYSESKRIAEMIGRIGSDRFGYAHKVARITALVGPRLPLDIHYAIGNFIRDAMSGGPIRILGDGSPVRSYLYVADLVAWLLVIMIKGSSNRPYNAGSDQGISLLEAATAFKRVYGTPIEIVINNQLIRDGRPNRYVPSVDRAHNELGLKQWTDLDSALRKTFDWHRGVNVS